jgi:hypothetical protein
LSTLMAPLSSFWRPAVGANISLREAPSED